MDIPKVTKFSENGKLFLRAFLLDATKNVNHWKVASASLEQRIRTFIGSPLTIYVNKGNEGDKQRIVGELDHPPYDYAKTARDNAIDQERYAIGRITDVVKQGSVWDAIIEVTDAKAREALENNDIPLYVSPRVYYAQNEPLDNLQNWFGAHLTVVDKPAFGEKAVVKGACYGEGEQCRIALADAKAADCGFCVKTELLKLVTNHADSSLSSLSLPSAKKQPSMENSTPNSTVDLSGYVPKGELEAVKAAFEAKIAETKNEYTAKIAAFEEERRKESIATIVNSKYADAKQAEEVAKKFVDAKVSPDFVKDILAKVPDAASQSKKDNTELFTGSKPADASAEPSGNKWYSAQKAYERSLIK